jgi:TPR repeat protein
MVTPPKTPANDRLSPKMRTIVAAAGLFATLVVAVLSLPSPWAEAAEPKPAEQEPTLTAENAAELCQKLFEDPKQYIGEDALRRRWDLRAASCRKAFDADPANTELKVAVARNLPYARKDEAVAMLREAAAQGNAEAHYQLYEHHKSWDRGDLDKVPLVTRTEAAEALRKAAELGHPLAMQTLVRRLEDGDIVKRDPVAARYWAERAVANPARDSSKAGLLVTLGRLLAASDKPDERARGLEILEGMSKAEVFGARRELAIAIRKEDPVRARTLLEEARRPDPGGAIVPLAEMLISGEGGPADPKRAVSLLKAASDSWMAKGMLGRLALEGKWVPRDVQEAVRLIDISSSYDFDARLQVMRLLAEHPEIRVSYPKRVLYDAVHAAELDEPGAMKALVELKLSANSQFQDRPGACRLIETAVSRGDRTMTQRLADCRAK